MLSTFDNLVAAELSYAPILCQSLTPVEQPRQLTMLRAVVALLVFLVASSEAIKCYECGPVEVIVTLVYYLDGVQILCIMYLMFD